MFFFEVLSLRILDLQDCDALPDSPDPNVCLGQREQTMLEKLDKRGQGKSDSNLQEIAIIDYLKRRLFNDDRRKHTLPPPNQSDCPDDKFQCRDGGCIPKRWRCDSFADCNDKSDEDKCSKCNVETEFYCGQEICINKELVCNGIRDCLDGRDERQCCKFGASIIYSHISSSSSSC